jgi:hypothetical protein
MVGRRGPFVWYQTIWASVHDTARRLFCGQSWKSGYKAQLISTCLGSILSINAILLFVQDRMAGPSPHSVSQCDKESFALHCLQLAVSVKFITAMRSRVGKMS